jgi:plasmid maintenance system antidote protein VapI
MSRTIGQAIDFLLVQQELYRKDVAEVMKINSGTLTKIIRDEKELSFLMAIRMLEKLGLSVDEFLSLLSKEELARKELSTLKWEKKNKIRKLKESSG